MNHENQNTSVAETSAADPLSIHQKAIAVDMHVDTAQRLLDEHVDIEQQLRDGHFDAVRAKAGGLDAQFFSIWVEPQLFGGGGAKCVKRACGRYRGHSKRAKLKYAACVKAVTRKR